MKNMYVPGLFNKPSLFTKNKLEETPIQRQSLQDLLSFGMPRKSRIAPKFSWNSFFCGFQINKINQQITTKYRRKERKINESKIPCNNNTIAT